MRSGRSKKAMKEAIERVFDLAQMKIIKRRADSDPSSIPNEAKGWLAVIDDILMDKDN